MVEEIPLLERGYAVRAGQHARVELGPVGKGKGGAYHGERRVAVDGKNAEAPAISVKSKNSCIMVTKPA